MAAAVRRVFRLLILVFVLGMCYATIELFFRGYTYVQMLWIGGLAGMLVGLLDEFPGRFRPRMWQQCLLGTLITVVIEFASGYLLNVKLRLGIWDYSAIPFNICGQICPLAAAGWFFLMPLVVYVDDWLRYKLFSQKKPDGGVLHNYKRLFTGK